MEERASDDALFVFFNFSFSFSLAFTAPFARSPLAHSPFPLPRAERESDLEHTGRTN